MPTGSPAEVYREGRLRHGAGSILLDQANKAPTSLTTEGVALRDNGFELLYQHLRAEMLRLVGIERGINVNASGGREGGL